MNVKRPTLILFFCFFYLNCISQTSINLSVSEGNSVEFFLKSYKDIADGKTLGTPPNGFTRIKIDYKQDADFSSTGWILTVRANTSGLFPDYSTTIVDLSSINLYVYLDGIYQTTISLSNVNQVIASKNISYPPLVALPESHSNEITIVYDCGTSEEFMGVVIDDEEYFRTDLIFNVQSQ